MSQAYRILWMGSAPPSDLSDQLDIDIESDPVACWEKVSGQLYDAYVVAANLKEGTGLDFIRRATRAFGVQPFIYLVDQMDLDEIEAMRQGVFDFITRRSSDREAILSTVSHVIERQRHIKRIQLERDKLRQALEFVPDLIFTMNFQGSIVSFKSHPDTYFDFFETQMKKGEGIDLEYLRKFIPPEVMRHIFYRVRQAIRLDQNFEFDFEIPTLTGPREFQARIFRKKKDLAVCLVRDLTALRFRERIGRSKLLEGLDSNRRFFRRAVNERYQRKVQQLKTELEGAMSDIRNLKKAERVARSLLMDLEAYELKWAFPATGMVSLEGSLMELAECHNALNESKLYVFPKEVSEENWDSEFKSDLYKVIVTCLDILDRFSHPYRTEVHLMGKGKLVRIEIVHDGSPLDWSHVTSEYKPLVEELETRIHVLNGETSRKKEDGVEFLIAEFPIYIH